MRVERLYRYPVKGLTPEALDEVAVPEGGCLPWDRAFALAQGDAPFDPEQPAWLPKSHFMCLMKNACIARLRSSFNPSRGTLVILAPDGDAVEGNALTEAGRARIGAWLARFLGPEARGAPRLHYVEGHSFCDERRRVVSLINLASLADFAARVHAPREKRRFRANIYFSSDIPWAERDWIGREIAIGGARLRVLKLIPRCPATEVNPATAERDADPLAELRSLYGSVTLGAYAVVEDGGVIAPGDGIEMLPG